ncbi:hypothetical protein K2173_010631 [Erythroxylum novogranatense]|uniref:Uncharacterized protein n=1 Tax=Erythroxylum novogranatense TaxID=1862640 RepID=A0AAV8TFV9_9ROSI|nr:hypothetical protein K2173_010631 [Erythroxylum novogranatense]
MRKESIYKKERKRKWEKEEEHERYNHHKRYRISHHRRRQNGRVRESNDSDVRRRRVAEGYGKYAVSERGRDSFGNKYILNEKSSGWAPVSCRNNGGILWDYIASRKHEDQDLLLRKAFFSKKMDFAAPELAHLLSEEPFNSVEVKCNIPAVDVEVTSEELCQEKKLTIISCCHGSEQLDVVSECGEQLESCVSRAKESSVLEFEDQEFSSETESTTSPETCIVELPNGVAQEVSQYQQLFENWVPLVMDCIHLESEDLEWLFETKFVRAPGTGTVEITNAKTEKLSNSTSTFIPRAQHLPHAEMNALRFTVPF